MNPAPPIDVGNRPQLFLDDDYLTESTQGVRVVLHQPTRFAGNPIIRPDQPWEDVQFGLHGYMGIAYDEAERLFKMWHGVYPPTRAVAYATSSDGFNWRKPALGIIEHNGSRQNNLVLDRNLLASAGLTFHGACQVFVDGGEANPARRFKATFKAEKEGAHGRGAAFSSDGIHWHVHPELLDLEHDSYVTRAETNIFWDERIRRYVRFSRMNTPYGARAIGRSESSDILRGWDRPRIVLAPDESDPPGVDLYSSGAFKHPHADNVYLMMVPTWDHCSAQIYLRLATSRDGAAWRWACGRQAFLPVGAPDTWDSHRLHPGLPSITVADTTFIYYVGHNVPTDLFAHKSGQIGVATLRRDGWISLAAGKSGHPPWEDITGGTVVTKPFRFTGSHLIVNGDIAGAGPENPPPAAPELRVELLDRDGQVIPGYDAERCVPVTAGAPRHQITWKGKDDLGAVVGETVRLRFLMRFTNLYGFQFG